MNFETKFKVGDTVHLITASPGDTVKENCSFCEGAGRVYLGTKDKAKPCPQCYGESAFDSFEIDSIDIRATVTTKGVSIEEVIYRVIHNDWNWLDESVLFGTMQEALEEFNSLRKGV